MEVLETVVHREPVTQTSFVMLMVLVPLALPLREVPVLRLTHTWDALVAVLINPIVFQVHAIAWELQRIQLLELAMGQVRDHVTLGQIGVIPMEAVQVYVFQQNLTHSLECKSSVKMGYGVVYLLQFHQLFFILQLAQQALQSGKSTTVEKDGGIAVAQEELQYAVAAVVWIVP